MKEDTLERFAVEHPVARRVLVLGAAAALLAYAAWRSPSIGALVAAAAGAVGAFASRAGDAVAVLKLGDNAGRWARTASFVGTTAGAVASVVFWREGTPLLALACAFLGGFCVPAAFLYPLPR